MLGATTWNASAAVPPWLSGSTNIGRIFWNSTIEPGQPWVTRSGIASSCFERAWMKWSSCPSMVVVNWGHWLSARSWARQS